MIIQDSNTRVTENSAQKFCAAKFKPYGNCGQIKYLMNVALSRQNNFSTEAAAYCVGVSISKLPP